MKEKAAMQERVQTGGAIELAVLGLGRWGGGPMLNTLSQLFPNIPIHGFARSNYPQWNTKTDLPENIRIHGAQDYQRALLDCDEIGAVFIATESSSHYRFTKEALLAGKDVLVEKPISQSKEAAAELVKIADQQGRILAVGYTLMYDATVNCLKKIMMTGPFDRVDAIKLNLLNPLAGRKLDFTASVIEDFVPHMLSLLHVLLGVREISDLCVESPQQEHAEISFQYDRIRVEIEVDRDYKGSRKARTIKIKTVDAAIEADLIHPSFVVTDREGVVLDRKDRRFPPLLLQETKDKPMPLACEFLDFWEGIQTRRLPRNAAKLTTWIPQAIDRITRKFKDG